MTAKYQIAKAQCERTAKEYYAFRKKGGTANDLIEIPAMKKLLGDVNNKKILDAGCGFGFYSIYCAVMGGIVTAVDISETMVDLAKQEAAIAGVEIEFVVKDVTDLSDFLPDIEGTTSCPGTASDPWSNSNSAKTLKGTWTVHPMQKARN